MTERVGKLIESTCPGRAAARGRDQEKENERCDGQNYQSFEEGFSLIEILVALAIIGMIMGLVAPRVLGYLTDSRSKTAQIQIQSLSAAIDLYYLDNGQYPTAEQGLEVLIRKPTDVATWNGPYLKGGSLPNDPWGRPYIYRNPGENAPYMVLSTGPNESGQQSQNALAQSR